MPDLTQVAFLLVLRRVTRKPAPIGSTRIFRRPALNTRTPCAMSACSPAGAFWTPDVAAARSSPFQSAARARSLTWFGQGNVGGFLPLMCQLVGSQGAVVALDLAPENVAHV